MAHPGQDMHPQLAVRSDAGQREGTLEVLLGEEVAVGVMSHPPGHVGERGCGGERQ